MHLIQNVACVALVWTMPSFAEELVASTLFTADARASSLRDLLTAS